MLKFLYLPHVHSLLCNGGQFLTTLAGESLPALAQLPSVGKFMIAMAMAAIGLNTNLVSLVKSGGKPILLGLVCWIFIALVSIGMQHVLGNLVKFTNIPHSTRKFHQKSTLRGAVLHCRCTLLN